MLQLLGIVSDDSSRPLLLSNQQFLEWVLILCHRGPPEASFAVAVESTKFCLPGILPEPGMEPF